MWNDISGVTEGVTSDVFTFQSPHVGLEAATAANGKCEGICRLLQETWHDRKCTVNVTVKLKRRKMLVSGI
jgi:hypothetical protein